MEVSSWTGGVVAVVVSAGLERLGGIWKVV